MMNQAFKNTLKTEYIVLLHILAGFAIGMAAQSMILIPSAIPFAVVLILLLRFLDEKAELLSWAGFTIWLGSTYLTIGTTSEYILFFVYIGLAALGIFKSPYFLAIAWLLHPLWDFMPRELPQILVDLPIACILFDVPIGLYILWGAKKKRWKTFGDTNTNQTWYSLDKPTLLTIGKALYVVLLLVLVSFVVLTSATSGLVIWLAFPLAMLLIFAYRILGSDAELIAWATFTGWLGMTYAHTGGILDAIMFFIYVGLAALGVFKSPLFLVAAWLLLVVWNFVPHHLPHEYHNLPIAITIFTIPIAIYLIWAFRQNRWKSNQVKE